MAAAAAGAGSGALKTKSLTVEIPGTAAAAKSDDGGGDDEGGRRRVLRIQHEFTKVMLTIPACELTKEKSERLSAAWIKAAYAFLFAVSGSSASIDDVTAKAKSQIDAVIAAYQRGDMKALSIAITELEWRQSLVYLSAAERPRSVFVYPRVIPASQTRGFGDFGSLTKRLSDTARDAPVEPSVVLSRLNRTFHAEWEKWRKRSKLTTPPAALSPLTVKSVDTRSDSASVAKKTKPNGDGAAVVSRCSLYAIGMSNLAYNTFAYLRRALFRNEHHTTTIKPGKDPLLGFCTEQVSIETIGRMRLMMHFAVMAMPGVGYMWARPVDICTYWITQCLVLVGQCSRFWTVDVEWQRFVNAQYAEAPDAWGDYLAWLLALRPQEAGYTITTLSAEPTRETWRSAITAACKLAIDYADQSDVERNNLSTLASKFYAKAKTAKKAGSSLDAWFADPTIQVCCPEPVVTVIHAFKTQWSAPAAADDPSEEDELYAHNVALITATFNTIAQRKHDRTKETFRVFYLQCRKGVTLTDTTPRPVVVAATTLRC